MSTLYSHQKPNITIKKGYYWIFEPTFGWMIVYWTGEIWRQTEYGDVLNDYFQIKAINPKEIKQDNPENSKHTL